MSDFDFTAIPKRDRKPCQDCGQTFPGFSDETCCVECQHYRDHPELAPKHWTWHRTGRKWTVAATWPDGESRPQVGDAITVHRGDGTASVETISEVDGVLYNQFGRGKLHCWVK